MSSFWNKLGLMQLAVGDPAFYMAKVTEKGYHKT